MGSKIRACDYHLCRKKREVTKCPYCEKEFCEEHIRPKPPGAPRFSATSYEDIAFMKEYHKPDGHPCPPFMIHWEEETAKKKDSYAKALDDVLKSSEHTPAPESIRLPNEEIRPTPIEHHTKQSQKQPPRVEEKHRKEYTGSNQANSENKKQGLKRELISSLKRWFYYKKHPYSYLDKHNLLMNLLYLSSSFLVLNIIYRNIELINEYIIIFLKLGSVILLVGTFLWLKLSFRTLKTLRYGIRSLSNGHEFILAFILISLLLFVVYPNQEKYVAETKIKIDSIQFAHFNPLCFENSSYLRTINLKEKIENEQTALEELLTPLPISNKTRNIEQAILKYTNQERKSFGIQELKWDDHLAKVARTHSSDMAENNFFDHTNLKGDDPTTRAVKTGYNVHKELGGGWYSDGIGENIGKMPTGNVEGRGYVSSDADSIAKAQVESWMSSPGHRANILETQYGIIGIGVAYDGQYYVSTQDFK